MTDILDPTQPLSFSALDNNPMSFDDAAKFDMGATLITSPIGGNTGYQRDYSFKPHTSYCKYLRIEAKQ